MIPSRQLVLALMLVTATTACRSRPQVLVPPRIDLAPHTRIGLVTFAAQNAQGTLPAFATQRFAEQLLRAQPGIEILELGELEGPVDASVVRRLGEQHDVRTVIVGTLVISDIKPRVQVFGGLGASAEATVSLATRLLSTESGGTLWTQSSRVRETLAAVSLVNGQAVFGAQDPQEAYGEIVDGLVWTLTRDFRATWQRQ
jgi:hypothetical protein